jgi:hypothetical protein
MTMRPEILIVLACALLPGLIPSSQAAEIKLVSPQAYANTEGGSAVGEGDFAPFRYQQILPAVDFAALGGKPHWITSFTLRPDRSLTSPRTVRLPDNQVRFSTTAATPATHSDRFDANWGPDVKQFYRGPVTLVADADSLSTVPRKFYQKTTPQGLTPFLYDPTKGNLLLDIVAWGGASPSTVEDKIAAVNGRTALYGESPTATSGNRVEAGIYQFTFVPVPEPSVTLLGVAFISVPALARRRR